MDKDNEIVCPDCGHPRSQHVDPKYVDLEMGCWAKGCSCDLRLEEIDIKVIARLTAERDALKAALEKYADEANWDHTEYSEIGEKREYASYDVWIGSRGGGPVIARAELEKLK